MTAAPTQDITQANPAEMAAKRIEHHLAGVDLIRQRCRSIAIRIRLIDYAVVFMITSTYLISNVKLTLQHVFAALLIRKILNQTSTPIIRTIVWLRCFPNTPAARIYLTNTEHNLRDSSKIYNRPSVILGLSDLIWKIRYFNNICGFFHQILSFITKIHRLRRMIIR